MRSLITIILALAAALGVNLATAAPELSAQSSMAAGVNITVTPRELAGDTWTFDVALVTHSGSLDDDVASETVLIADSTQPRQALAWKGSAPGGHHRSGLLSFRGSKEPPSVIELRVQRPGEASARSFRWKLH